MPACLRVPRYAGEGFTLIEVLIAMTLLGIMVVLLFGSMRICAESWEKGEIKIEEVNQVAVVYNFFQRHLSAAKPLWDDFTVAGERSFTFQGNSEFVQFVSGFPASAGRAGLQLFTIKAQEEDQEQIIKVSLVPFYPSVEGEALPREEVTLIKNVSKFSLAYLGANETQDDAAENLWQEEWLNQETQPRLVKIHIELENGIYWPDMVIELKVAGDNSQIAVPAEDSGEEDTDAVDDSEAVEELSEPEVLE